MVQSINLFSKIILETQYNTRKHGNSELMNEQGSELKVILTSICRNSESTTYSSVSFTNKKDQVTQVPRVGAEIEVSFIYGIFPGSSIDFPLFHLQFEPDYGVNNEY